MKKIKTRLYFLVTLLFLAIPEELFARGEAIDKVQKGTSEMIADIQRALIILVPTVAGLALLTSAGMRSISSEENKMVWDKRMKNSLIFSVVAILATAIVTTVLGYFK